MIVSENFYMLGSTDIYLGSIFLSKKQLLIAIFVQGAVRYNSIRQTLETQLTFTCSK